MDHPVMPMLHPQRRDGAGLLQSPTVRKGELCAVENCRHFANTIRVTESGYYVAYCGEHSKVAEDLFS